MCDLEDPRIWEEHTVRPRKAHRCSDCDELILKGELHLDIHALYNESGWSNFRLHLECMAWRKAHQAWMRTYWRDDCGAEMGGLVAALEEAHHEMHGRPARRPHLALAEALRG